MSPDNSIIWRPIPGLEGRYSVSNTGLVRSDRELLTLKSIPRRGYLMVNLYYAGGLMLKRSIHRQVGAAFLPNPDNKPQINHKNGIKTDNRAENLEWVTARENNLHARRTGLWRSNAPKGEAHPRAKLTEAKVREIRLARSTLSFTEPELARRYGVSVGAISAVVCRKSWKSLDIP